MTEDKKEMVGFPYYVIPNIHALAHEHDPARLRIHRRRVAACIGDPDALRAILGDASEDFQDFYGVSTAQSLSTADTIDSFLRMFGSKGRPSSLRWPGVPDSGSVPVAPPAVNYAEMMERDAPSTAPAGLAADPTMGAIDSFLKANPAPRVRPRKDPKEVEKPSLTESFAKILIKNGNYSRALEIITEISLNNPEKSIYFADQIRFLKKVISLESLKP